MSWRTWAGSNPTSRCWRCALSAHPSFQIRPCTMARLGPCTATAASTANGGHAASGAGGEAKAWRVLLSWKVSTFALCCYHLAVDTRREVMHRHSWFLVPALVVLSATAAPTQPSSDKLPITGLADPALASFDELMITFMREHQVPGAALAVTRDGRLVYARGFGYADRRETAAGQAATPCSASPASPSRSPPWPCSSSSSRASCGSTTRSSTCSAGAIRRRRGARPTRAGRRSPSASCCSTAAAGTATCRSTRCSARRHRQGAWRRPPAGPRADHPVHARPAARLRPRRALRLLQLRLLRAGPDDRRSAAGEPTRGYVRKHILEPIGVRPWCLGQHAARRTGPPAR